MELLSKGLDLSVGVISVYLIRYRWKQNTGSNTIIKDLIKELEEKDKQIVRLEMELKTWKHHHERLTNRN